MTADDVNTYDFLIIDFQTTDNKVHRFLCLAVGLSALNVQRVGLVRRTLQIKSVLVAIDNLEHSHVLLGVPAIFSYLLLEAPLVVVMVKGELVAKADDHGFIRGFERLLGQMSTLVVEEAVTIATPRNALHQDTICQTRERIRIGKVEKRTK